MESFDNWFKRLQEVANSQRFPLREKSEYLDYYRDGSCPLETIQAELRYLS